MLVFLPDPQIELDIYNITCTCSSQKSVQRLIYEIFSHPILLEYC